jgi:diguanylate cyclase (GGDEF)-like protein
MIKPAIPSDESQRLQTLRDLRLLDTPPEERFDRVTRLAKQVFSTRIALVSLVDADRQWFKSRQGLDAEQTAREISFCGHAILDDEILVINDAEIDERFCDNPLVCGDPNIRFYAGCPLTAPDGSRVGTLCIIDDKPRELTSEQFLVLRDLGRMVEEEFIAANETTTDPTTGISNRNGFLDIADRLLPVCRRNNEPATLLMFHLDELYKLEDTHGRYLGDTVVSELARLLMNCFRASDMVARTSLDTFAVLLVSTDLDGAEHVQSRVDELIRKRNNDSSRPHELRVKAYPVAFDADGHKDAEMFLQYAEARLGATYEEQGGESQPPISCAL